MPRRPIRLPACWTPTSSSTGPAKTARTGMSCSIFRPCPAWSPCQAGPGCSRTCMLGRSRSRARPSRTVPGMGRTASVRTIDGQLQRVINAGVHHGRRPFPGRCRPWCDSSLGCRRPGPRRELAVLPGRRRPRCVDGSCRVEQPTPNGPIVIATVRDPDGVLVLLTPGSITRAH